MIYRTLERLRFAVVLLLVCAALCGTALADGELIPGGEAVGIQMEIDGVLVADTNEFMTKDGAACPARAAGIRAGDVITAVNGCPVDGAAAFSEQIGALSGAAELTVLRDGKSRSVTVTPAVDTDGAARLGLWLRDGITGVGTITYIDPESGIFGALGHGVNDLSAGALLPTEGGSICRAQIIGVTPGAPGAPGELAGHIDAGAVVGRIERNTESGIFGVIGSGAYGGEAIPVGSAADVKNGAATILACVAGRETCEYDVEITRTGVSAGDGRDLMVRVTDPKLLSLTGGIVQGMSGSPILQNGRLVGAVTHVLVGDPSRGYGIFIENMLRAASG